jgi:GNAT superfamily N-acetyltransferase
VLTEIRARTADDLVVIVDVLRRVHKTNSYPINWPADPVGWLSEADEAWVALQDGRIAGHIGLVHGRARSPDTVERFFVDPDSERVGLGRALLEHAVRHSRSATLELVVADNGARAQRLYEATGWVEQHREVIDWGGSLAATVIRYRLTKV